MSHIKCGLHWYTLAVPLGTALDRVMDVVGGNYGQHPEIGGGFNHPHHMLSDRGVRIYFGSRREDQPIVINATGEVCESWSDELISAAAELEARVTRADLAVDIGPANLATRRLLAMVKAWEAGRVKTRIEKAVHIRPLAGAAKGHTLYVGSETSTVRMCAYDERGDLRIEWRIRPDNQLGDALPEILARKGVAPVWRALAFRAVFPMTWYRELLEGDVATWDTQAGDPSSFTKTVEYLRDSYGSLFFALYACGLELSDLAVEPDKPRGRDLVKWRTIADTAAAAGYDGTKLQEIIKCKSRQRRVRV